MKSFRLHVSGLPSHITESDLLTRFQPFGTVHSVTLVPDQFSADAKCRGFAYVQLEAEESQVQKCMGLLNGSSWKGGKLQISFAKPIKFVNGAIGKGDSIGGSSGSDDGGKTGEDSGSESVKSSSSSSSRSISSNESTDNTSSSSTSKSSKRKKRIRLAKDLSPVTDKSASSRKGWRLSRYGRAVAVMRLRRPDGTVIVIDPVHYKAGLEKLFGTMKPKELKQLDWGEAIGDGNSSSGSDSDSDSGSDSAEKLLFSQGELEVEFVSSESDGIEADEKKEKVGKGKVEKSKKEKKEKTVGSKKEKTEKTVGSKKEKTEKTVEKKKEKKEKTEKTVEKKAKVDDQPDEPVSETSTIIPSTDTPQSEASALPPSIQIQMDSSAESTESTDQPPQEFDPIRDEPAVEPFQVNVSWNELFSPAAAGSSFSLNLFGSSKPLPVVEAVVPTTSVASGDATSVDVQQPSQASTKKNFNFASLFASSPSVKKLFGCTDRPAAVEKWRQERFELKADFRKKVADGKRKQRKRKMES